MNHKGNLREIMELVSNNFEGTIKFLMLHQEEFETFLFIQKDRQEVVTHQIKELIETSDDVLYKEIVDILLRLKLDETYKGFSYLKESLFIVTKGEYYEAKNGIYNKVAKKLGTTNRGVEAGITRMIRMFWENPETEEIRKEIFGDDVVKIPTNTEFVYIISKYLVQ